MAKNENVQIQTKVEIPESAPGNTDLLSDSISKETIKTTTLIYA